MQVNNHIKNLLEKFALNKCSKAEVDEVILYFSKKITASNQLPSVEEVLAPRRKTSFNRSRSKSYL